MAPSALFTLPALRRARDLIDLRYAEPLDLAALAREAGYSKFHFHRAFAAAYGETPHAYLTRRRLERAKTLLRVANLSVTEICFLVGFESLGSFSALFRRVVGQTPSEYRRASVRAGRASTDPRLHGPDVDSADGSAIPEKRGWGRRDIAVAAPPTEDQP